MKPMLATPGGENAHLLCDNDDWYASVKMDGHRLIVEMEGQHINFLSRTGKPLPVTDELWTAFNFLTAVSLDGRRIVLDGEYMPKEGRYYVFDLPELTGFVGIDTPLEQRLALIPTLLADAPDCIEVLPYWTTTKDKTDAVHRIKNRGGEGLVFKKRGSKYQPNRRSKAWVKLKFVHDVDCVIVDANRNGKTNWALAVNDGKKWVEVGEVSGLTGDKDLLQIGDVVKVTCLYASEDNRLVQPVSPKKRDDKTPLECTLDQLDTIRPNRNISELIA